MKALWLLAAVLALLAGPAAAQSLTALGEGGGPLEITAQQGIEWRRSEGYYLARGDAIAQRGEVVVRADELRAYVEGESLDGLTRIEAIGQVRIETPRETARGDKAVYTIADGRLVMTGGNLQLLTENETLTAEESLEYDEPGRRAIARGDATLRRAGQRLSAVQLEAFLSDAGEGGAEEGLGVERVEATGGVEVATPNEFVTGRRGTYYVAREVATLEGGVKITRGENQLNGEYAEVDLKAGVSRLLANPPAGEVGAEGPSKPERVRGLLVPRSLDN